MRRFQDNKAWPQRTYMVIPKAHTSLYFDCLTVPCPFHNSGAQNAYVPFVVVVTSPNDRLMSAAIRAHPKSLTTALPVRVMRMLSFANINAQCEDDER